MAFTRNTVVVNNITNQPNQPIISATALKALFDQSDVDQKSFDNSVLLPELESITDGDSGADNIGCTIVVPGTTTATIQHQIEKVFESIPTPTTPGTADYQLETNHTGTAAVWRKKPYVNVMDFGAIGDGVADDTVSIQSAIDSISATGGLIVFPSGIYRITNTINIVSKIRIEGNSIGSTTLKIDADNVVAIRADNKNNIAIMNLSIDGSGSFDNTGKKGGHGIYLEGTSNFFISNVEIYNMGATNTTSPINDTGWGGFGIVVKSLTTISTESKIGVIENCVVRNIAGSSNYGDGIAIIGNNVDINKKGKYIIIEKCFVSTCGRHCYSVSGNDGGGSVPENIEFTNCYAEKSGLSGIDLEIGNDITITGVTFISCGNDNSFYNPALVFGASERLMSGVATTSLMKNVFVDNCIFDTCYNGINVGDTDCFEITNNIFENTTYASGGDIFTGLSATFKKSTISNNVMKNSAGHGIYALANTDVVDLIIEGNVISGAYIGVRLYGSNSNPVSDIIFSKNIIKNCKTNGVTISQLDGVLIDGNIVKDNGINGVANQTYGIYIENFAGMTTTKYIITSNRIYDTRVGGLKTQTFSLVCAPLGGGVMDFFIITQNDFRGNVNPPSYATVGGGKIVANNLQ